MANTRAIRSEIQKNFQKGNNNPFDFGTENTWYVSSLTGNAGFNGKSPTTPVLTIEAAVALATANDTIIVLPGYTGTISSATQLVIALAGLYILGKGRGSLRPTLTLDTAASAGIKINASNVLFSNFIFVANFADITSCFKFTAGTAANELRLEDCEFRDTDATHNFVTIISSSTTANQLDGLAMVRCKRFGAGATTGTTIINLLGTNTRFYFEDCYFTHLNVDDGGLFMLIATTKVLTNMEVVRCKFNFLGVSSAAAGVLITTDTSTNSGYFLQCYCKHLDATSEIMVTASSGFVFWDLKAAAVADKNAFLVPAADA